MRMANRSNARHCFLIGRDELDDGMLTSVTIKDMSDSSQRSVPRAEAVEEMQRAAGRESARS